MYLIESLLQQGRERGRVGVGSGGAGGGGGWEAGGEAAVAGRVPAPPARHHEPGRAPQDEVVVLHCSLGGRRHCRGRRRVAVRVVAVVDERRGDDLGNHS